MIPTASYWIAACVPGLLLLFVYAAYRRVLKSKRMEMRMLLARGSALGKYLAAYGGPQSGMSEVPNSAPVHEAANAEAHANKLTKAPPQEKADRDTPKSDVDKAQIENIIDRVFQLNYNTAEYAYSLSFTFLISTFVIALALATAGLPLGLPADVARLLATETSVRSVVAGGIGAMIWGVYDLMNRYRATDLTPVAVFGPGVKIIIVAAVGAAVAAIIKDTLAWPVAFALGAVPIGAISDFLAERARKSLQMPMTERTGAHPPLTILQGWSADVADRLEQVGVTTVQQVAYFDPFRLLLRTNLDWKVILDLRDQAILALYVKEKIDNLRLIGIRGVTEIALLEWHIDELGTRRETMLDCVAKALGVSTDGAAYIAHTAATDPTVQLLATLWAEDA